MVICGEQALSDRHRALTGAVLLEVVLALALLLFAIGVVNSGLQASVDAVDRMKANAQAMNLAVSVISEVQMGLVPMESAEAQPFLEPFGDWTYEIQAENFCDSLLGQTRPIKVEVIVRHTTKPYVRRVAQVMPPGGSGAASKGGTSMPSDGDSGFTPLGKDSSTP